MKTACFLGLRRIVKGGLRGSRRWLKTHPMQQFRWLNIVTVNTGHNVLSPRTDVRDESLWKLEALLDNYGGPIPAHNVHVKLSRPINPMTHRPSADMASWSIFDGLNEEEPGPLLMKSITCWSDTCAKEAWDLAMMCFRALGCPPHPRLKRPNNVPWLATVLFPGVNPLTNDALIRIAQLDRQLAWASIEMPS